MNRTSASKVLYVNCSLTHRQPILPLASLARHSHRKVRKTSNVRCRDLIIYHTDWGHVTPDEAKDPSRSPVYVYFASKLLAEKALWGFVKEHPQLDVVTSESYLPLSAHHSEACRSPPWLCFRPLRQDIPPPHQQRNHRH